MTRLDVCLSALLLMGCGGNAMPAAKSAPQHAQRAPSSSTERLQALQEFAERLFHTLQVSHVVEVVFDDATLDRLLDARSAARAGALRYGMPQAHGMTSSRFELLRGARFGGACFQGVRDEPAGSMVGLREDGWVFDRVLLVGREPSGLLAVWVEGEFLWTDSGFGAISIQSVETPRRNHADLELAVCDVDLGVRRPLPVVSEGALNH